VQTALRWKTKVSDTQMRRIVGRYELYDSIASGGMATIHLGRLLGEVGFVRVVAIKRLHPHLASDPEFAAMLLDEARLAAGISHPNVVSTLDVVTADGEIFLVMDYIEGDSLSHLVRFTRRAQALVEPAIVSGVMSGALYGLHAAHTATDERGNSLNIVHRDFSPQNILIGTDGVPRVLDFGVAKAARRIAQTEAGRTKGKFSYMAPEQVRMGQLDHRADIFSAGICTWEALTGRVLFGTDDPGRTIAKVIECEVPAPSTLAPGIDPTVDAIVLRALAKDPNQRFQTARERVGRRHRARDPAQSRRVGVTPCLGNAGGAQCAFGRDGKRPPRAHHEARTPRAHPHVGQFAARGRRASTDGPDRRTYARHGHKVFLRPSAQAARHRRGRRAHATLGLRNARGR
jgi:serine/threonine-protein kinase